tara:strand:- start:224 stop:1444 length:1221 start_codon:yes stop_codon:yes gene_type:complete
MITKIKNIGKIVTWDIANNKIKNHQNQKLEILIKNNSIFKIGENFNNIAYDKVIDAKGGLITPGFIDCHTHPIFYGNRSLDFKLRTEGKTYEEISSQGGGIKSSIDSVRESSFNELFKKSSSNIESFIKKGTTTIEAKSGYGLTLKDEIKSLEVIKELNKRSALDIVPTFMGAHDFPPEYANDKEGYVNLICDEMIPEVADKKLALFCDVFCEKGYFNIKQSEKILSAGVKYGLIPRLHADEFIDSDAARLAADMKAVSADHLMFASDENFKKMADSNVMSVILPGTTFFLGKKEYVDANKILDFGGEIAIASDYNPGSCFIQSMPLIMLLSNLYCNLPIDLSFKACTYNAAKVLRKEKEIGLVKEGYNADLLIWNLDSLEAIPYSFDNTDNNILNVIKNGNIVCS